MSRLAHAQDLYEAMQQVLEDRDTPVVESHLSDFYEHDRASVANQFAPNSRYLWLLHPHGTHFGRIGVLPADDTYMFSALQAYTNAFAPHRMEVHMIDVDALGAARIRLSSFREGMEACSRRDYSIEGNKLSAVVTHRGSSTQVGHIAIKQYAEGPGVYAATMAITTGGRPGREHLIALAQVGYRMAAKATGSLFSKVSLVTIDGVPVDEAIPELQVKEATPGQFASPRTALSVPAELTHRAPHTPSVRMRM